ncbi:MAG: hypothetical protein WCJ30_18355, partial [Deltaproteobacteria bacterium]
MLVGGALATRSLLVGGIAVPLSAPAPEPLSPDAHADVVVHRAGLTALRVSNVTGPVECREREDGGW